MINTAPLAPLFKGYLRDGFTAAQIAKAFEINQRYLSRNCLIHQFLWFKDKQVIVFHIGHNNWGYFEYIGVL